MSSVTLKNKVREFWNSTPCGTYLAKAKEGTRKYYSEIDRLRYSQAPYRYDFLPEIFDRMSLKGKAVLEIGCGVGTDSAAMAKRGGLVTGVDLTKAAIKLAKKRFQVSRLTGKFLVADAEKLPFRNDCFDRVYSFGVLHHTPDTKKTFDEIHRVLKKGGVAVVGLYYRYSWNYLWLLINAIIWPHLWKLSFSQRINEMTEGNKNPTGPVNPLTKVFSRGEMLEMGRKFSWKKTELYWSNIWGIPKWLETFLGNLGGWYVIIWMRK